MKHNKIIAGLAVAGSLLAVSGAANAISPAAAIGLAAISGAALGSAAAQAHYPYVATVPAVPATPATVVMGAPAAPVVSGHYEVINGVYTWVPTTSTVTTGVTNFDHDGDGVQNSVDRFPNDPGRS